MGYLQSETFRKVTYLNFKEYKDSIIKPMALDFMSRKLSCNEYLSISSFLFDVRLMFDNCRAFHDKRTIFFKDAKVLEQHMYQTLHIFSPQHVYIFKENLR